MRIKWMIGVAAAGFWVLPGSALGASWNLIVGDAGPENAAQARLVRVNPVTGAQTSITHTGKGNLLALPGGVAVARNGTLFVADEGSDGNGAVIKVNPVTGKQTLLARGGAPGSLVYDPDGIAVDADGTLLVADFRGPGGSGALGLSGGVLRLDPKTGKQTAVSRSDQAGNLFVNPAAVAVESATSILVTDFSAFGGPGGVIRVDPVTGAQTAVSPTGTSGPSLFTLGARGLAIGAAGSLFALNQSSPPEVIRIAEATGQQTLVTENGLLHGVDGIGLTPYGKLVVGNSIGDTGSVVRVDPGTGKQSKVAHGGFLHAPDSVLVASARPLISRFSISRSKFRVAKGATALVARLPRGATFSYRCSEAATIAMRIKRVGRNGHLTSIGKLVRTAQAGRNQLVFTGRIGSRKLNPGTYEALIRASVPYAPVSATRSLRFSIVR